jgi:hypothetical protein
MNFLTHYYCDRKTADPFYNLGLAVPDLMSMFKRGWRIGNHQLKYPAEGKYFSIIQGVKQHLLADQYFHQSDFFLRSTSMIKQLMLEKHLQYRGTHFLFLSHLLLEICIDRIIVTKFPEVVADFYSDISAVPPQIVNDFFDEIEVPIPEGFFVFYERFARDKFLYNYDDIEKIIFMYNRILTRINMIVIDPGEYEKLGNVILSIDDILFAELYDHASFGLLTAETK